MKTHGQHIPQWLIFQLIARFSQIIWPPLPRPQRVLPRVLHTQHPRTSTRTNSPKKIVRSLCSWSSFHSLRPPSIGCWNGAHLRTSDRGWACSPGREEGTEHPHQECVLQHLPKNRQSDPKRHLRTKTRLVLCQAFGGQRRVSDPYSEAEEEPHWSQGPATVCWRGVLLQQGL